MEYFMSVSVMIAIFVILAASYNLVIGYGGLATVAHPIFFALGAYTAALLAIHTGPAGIAAACWQVLRRDRRLGAARRSSLRVSGDYLLIASIGFQLGLLQVIRISDSPADRAVSPISRRSITGAARTPSYLAICVPARRRRSCSSRGSCAAHMAAPSLRCAMRNLPSRRLAATPCA